MQHDAEVDGSGARLWGPYAVTAGAAGFGWVLQLAAGGMGLAVAAGLLLVPPIVLAVAHARGRYLLGVDRRGELVYAAGCVVALAGWVGAAGMTAWPEAALVAAAVTGTAAGWQVYGPGQRPAGIAAAVAVGAAVVAGLLMGATREPNPVR